jgi:hypothetical protein
MAVQPGTPHFPSETAKGTDYCYVPQAGVSLSGLRPFEDEQLNGLPAGRLAELRVVWAHTQPRRPRGGCTAQVAVITGR